MRVDGYSASAIVQVYDALNTQNKKKFSDAGLMKSMPGMTLGLQKKRSKKHLVY